MQWVAIQHNPRSGAMRQSQVLLDLIAGLRAHGLRPRLFSRRAEMDAALADPARRGTLHGIVAAGGDGTLIDVLNRHPGVPIGILPLGTENLVARYLGVPRCGRTAARIVAEGYRRRFDMGRIGDRRFTIMVTFGFDADVVHRMHAIRTGHITRWSYLPPIWNALCHFGYPELRVYVDDDPTPIRGRGVLIANLPSYALGLNVIPTARVDDGRFDIRVFQRGSAFHLLRYLFMVKFGWNERLGDVVRRQGSRISVESDVPIPGQADGDPAGTTPASITVEPDVAELFAPRGSVPAMITAPIVVPAGVS